MKKLIWILLAIVVVGAAIYFYVFHKPHRDLAGEEATVTLTADELHNAFASNASEAQISYLDKVVEVEGVLDAISDSVAVMTPGIACTMLHPENLPQEGDELTIKGRVVGYDDLFEEVKLDFCTVEE